jgi:hypothetical protein
LERWFTRRRKELSMRHVRDSAAIGKRLLCALLALGLMFGTASGARAGTASGQNVPDLTGDWSLTSGGTPGVIHIHATNSPGAFPTLTNWFISGAACPYGDKPKRSRLFDRIIFQNKDTFSGDMEVCTRSQVLVEKCGVTSLFTVHYETTSISKTTIVGTLTAEWFDGVPGEECKFQRNASKDTKAPFTLTRADSNPCPDTDAIKAYSKDSNRAVGVIQTAIGSGKIQNAQVIQGLSSTQSALNKISNVLGTLSAAGDDCDKIHSVLSQIEQFQSAIDQINNAGCDSMAEAGGFDNLFRTAGQLGGSLGSVPGLGPVFTLLASDQNFFQAVEGNLNPEQRWADQFQYVDGYIPNCPH